MFLFVMCVIQEHMGMSYSGPEMITATECHTITVAVLAFRVAAGFQAARHHGEQIRAP